MTKEQSNAIYALLGEARSANETLMQECRPNSDEYERCMNRRITIQIAENVYFQMRRGE